MDKTHTLLFVDDEVNILHSLQRLFRREGYNILTATGGQEGLELLKGNMVSLVISDNRMPEMDGVEFLSKVREVSPSTVRFMLTGYADIKAVVGAINSGEVSRYVTKPWNDDELKLLVKDAVERYSLTEENKRLLELTQRQNLELTELNRGLEARVAEKTRKIRENFFAFVRIFADIMELHDPDIGGHSKRVAELSTELAARMGLDEQERDLIGTAGLLHGVGLIGAPRHILGKNEDDLTDNERALLRHSPLLTQSLLASIDTLREAGVIIRCHMERFDGKGYPDGLRKEEIPLGARILAACKVYDTARFERATLGSHVRPPEWVRAEMGKWLDPEVAKVLLKLVEGRKEEGIVITVDVKDLKGGMVLADNLITSKGRLLVARNTQLTAELIDKIINFDKIDPVVDVIKVLSAA